MDILNKHYQVMEEAPKEISWEKYISESMKDYCDLLSQSHLPEKDFQCFFEKNPSFIPGALELLGHTSHYPFMDTIISQPELGIEIKRKPDFLWLAQDSLNFVPVFVEIEKPEKKMFTANGIPTAEFNQALNQIDEWRSLLKDPDNIRVLYKFYSIPLAIQNKVFKPQFLLIYGRRSEYDKDIHLARIRAAKERSDVVIMSFDRLCPTSDYKQFISCTVMQGKYHVLHIPPTFRYRADCVDTLKQYVNFTQSIPYMEKTSKERMDFLSKRYSYWTDNAESIMGGIIVSHEGE